MFRKSYLLMVVILIAATLTSCGGGAATPTATAAPTATTAPTATAAPTATTAVTTLQDNTHAIQVSVPSDWTDVDGSTFQLPNTSVNFASIKASTSLTDITKYTAPGVWVMASSQLAQIGGYIQMLDAVKDGYSNCQYDGRNNYSDGTYEGAYDLFHDCDQSGNSLLILSVRPIQHPTDFLVFVLINSPSGQSADAANQMAQTILNSFNVVGNLP